MDPTVYQEYGPYFYVPMTQGTSLAVPVTVGCSWDQCLYCDLNHGHHFRIFSLDEIAHKLTLLKAATAHRRHPVGRVVLSGGNPFCLKTDRMLAIIALIRTAFPQVQTISAFARAEDILAKTREELLLLKSHGMDELSIGVESGNDEVLAFHRKGETRADMLEALRRLESCGISYSTYIMLGLGGKRLSKQHALDTASLLSQLDPQVITVVTLVLFPDAPLIGKVRTREFVRLSVRESLEEERLLLEHLMMRQTVFNATHKTNALILKGRLPDHQAALLGKIDQALAASDPHDLSRRERTRWRNWSTE